METKSRHEEDLRQDLGFESERASHLKSLAEPVGTVACAPLVLEGAHHSDRTELSADAFSAAASQFHDDLADACNDPNDIARHRAIDLAADFARVGRVPLARSETSRAPWHFC
jgi:hypothetical protein